MTEKTETSIGKRGLSARQADKIASLLEAVNGRASRWTASVGWVLGAMKVAEEQLEAARLPAAHRQGAVAECFTDAPWAKAYRHAVKGNRIVLRRASKGWVVTAIETATLYPRDSRAERVKITISADQAERMKAAAIAAFAIQRPLLPVSATGADGFNAADSRRCLPLPDLHI